MSFCGASECIAAMTAAIASLEVASIDADQLGAAVLHAEQLLNAANALSASLLERFEQDGSWGADGALSAATWTAERSGSARSSIRSRLRQGRAMTELPSVAEKARSGQLSAEHLRSLSACVHRHPELARSHEQVWLDQADLLHAEGFRVATRHWLEAVADLTSPDPADRPGRHREEVSRLHLARTFEGWLRLDGIFAPHDAQLIDAALDAGVDRALRAVHDGDPSVTGQSVSELRAASLVDLVAQSMRREPSDASAPDRYRLAVVVRPGESLSPAEAACDGTAFRVVMDVEGEVLDVGRQTSRWPVALRRAITARDGGCVFPGCDRPPSWTEIHHCLPWRDGGTTSVGNGVLVCRRHHTFIHRQHWRITIDGGHPTTRRPDGTPHTIQRWHPGARAS